LVCPPQLSSSIDRHDQLKVGKVIETILISGHFGAAKLFHLVDIREEALALLALLGVCHLLHKVASALLEHDCVNTF